MLLLQTVMQFFSTKDVSHIFLSCNTKEIFCINVRKKVEEREEVVVLSKSISFWMNKMHMQLWMHMQICFITYMAKKLSFLVWLLPPSFVPGKFLHYFHQILFRGNSSEKSVFTYCFFYTFDYLGVLILSSYFENSN